MNLHRVKQQINGDVSPALLFSLTLKLMKCARNYYIVRDSPSACIVINMHGKDLEGKKGDGETGLPPPHPTPLGKDFLPGHFEATSFLAPLARNVQGSCSSPYALGGLRDTHETRIHLRTGRIEKPHICGLRPGKRPYARTGRHPQVKSSTNGHMWITTWLFLKRGYLGRVNFGFCFTFIFKVEYFSGIRDNGLEKPVSHHI